MHISVNLVNQVKQGLKFKIGCLEFVGIIPEQVHFSVPDRSEYLRITDAHFLLIELMDKFFCRSHITGIFRMNRTISILRIQQMGFPGAVISADKIAFHSHFSGHQRQRSGLFRVFRLECREIASLVPRRNLFVYPFDPFFLFPFSCFLDPDLVVAVTGWHCICLSLFGEGHNFSFKRSPTVFALFTVLGCRAVLRGCFVVLMLLLDLLRKDFLIVFHFHFLHCSDTD